MNLARVSFTAEADRIRQEGFMTSLFPVYLICFCFVIQVLGEYILHPQVHLQNGLTESLDSLDSSPSALTVLPRRRFTDYISLDKSKKSPHTLVHIKLEQEPATEWVSEMIQQARRQGFLSAFTSHTHLYLYLSRVISCSNLSSWSDFYITVCLLPSEAVRFREQLRERQRQE